MRKGFKFHRVFIVFLFTIGLFFGSASSSQAGWLWNSNVDEQTDRLQKSLLEAKEGNPSQGSHTVNTNEFFLLDVNKRLVGVNKEELRKASYSPSEIKVLTDRYGNGVIGEVSGAIAYLFDQPASLQTFVADILETAHIIPKAQAQGLGFASLDPILETWKVFRNVAYLFFVVIFLVIGFMIMFRHKISGQTVVTAQQAIPSILVALVFVTFSYAIAGFLIDLMYLLMYLMIGIFQPGGGTDILSKNFLGIGAQLVKGTDDSAGAWGTVNAAVTALVHNISPTGDGAITNFLGWIGGLTMSLIVSIAILIGVFKLFFELLKTYITIIVLIVTAPLSLMASAIPGKNNFGDWIKKVFGNLLAFPMVLFALILFEMFTANDLSKGGFLPPFMIGRGQGGVVMSLVGIGIILVIPEMIKEMKKALKVGGGVFESLAGAAGKNAQSGEVGIPLISGAASGIWGAGRAAKATRGKKMGTRERFNAVFREGVTVDAGDGSEPTQVGGFARTAGKGWSAGQKVRKVIDRAQEGRLFEAEDLEKTLSRIANREKSGDKEPIPSAGPKPSP